ncbi:glycine betaine ABC transporter substrate-binding protein [Fusobacterium sp.]|uniref:ABC transporter permease/substrate-binding protein n=1 Tax=Fusobacterium sp. TaxID=68766 RepID=UPI002636DABF|nr:glycine betaine ABC transporter substrate-binding protein [Fusobacterium sp.]
MNFLNYLLENKEQIFILLKEHIELTILSVTLAILIGVPIGIIVSQFQRINKPVMGVANTIQAIPSMALLGFLIPFFGIGFVPSIFMVVLYSLLPIIKNTFMSISGINPQIKEAAEGIGMTRLQILFKVQIPMALPIIMAGVRISAVTAVGLMTIAAYIGAGGLGYLVFSGIRTANNYQILAGAIPACLLALFIDFVASIIEKAVVPYGLRLNEDKSSKRERLFQKFTVIAVIAVVIFTFFNVGVKKFSEKRNSTVTIATKDFTEQEILGNILAELVENKTDLKVKRKFGLGGTQVAFGALKTGEADLYMEYTGTLYTAILNHNPISEKLSSEDVYNVVKKELGDKYNLSLDKQLKFNNTYRIGVRKDIASNYNLKTISDLERVSSNLILSPTLEFMNRKDGFLGLKNMYTDLDFKKIVPMDDALRYKSLDLKESDVIDVFSTDGLIKTYDVKVLEDDKNYFLPYHAVLLIKNETLEKHPELLGISNELENIMTDEVMRELNYQVDDLKRKPEEVAHEFLTKYQLID